MQAVLWPLLLQVILIALNAVFACAEIAVISVNDNKLAQLVAQGDKRALRLARLTSRPAQFLATIQIAITLSGFLGSAFAADHFSDRLVALLLRAGVPIPEKTLDTLSVILITLLLSYFTLVFGELVPKRLAMKKSESLAMGLSALISAISAIFAPVVTVLTASTNGVATHRTELDLLWTSQTTEEWKQILFETRHTRYPVCAGSVDQVVGILDARDFFRLQDRPIQEILDTVVKPAFFVPETLKADVLFQQMKQRRTYYAVVLDEYGGLLGVVTIRDLLEQLVGEIQQEGELTEIQPLEEGTWRIQGSAPLDDVARTLGVDLPLEEYDTFGGYVFGLYGSVPQDGRNILLQTDRLQIQMTQIQHHRLEEALVTLLPEGKEDP